jgi:hypothetical protein
MRHSPCLLTLSRSSWSYRQEEAPKCCSNELLEAEVDWHEIEKLLVAAVLGELHFNGFPSRNTIRFSQLNSEKDPLL